MNNYTKYAVFAAFSFTLFSFGQKTIAVKNIVPSQNPPKQVSAQAILQTNLRANPKPKPKFNIVQGSFSANLKNEQINSIGIESNFNQWLNLSSNHSFQKVSERTDELGITHSNFQQFYKNYAVEGTVIMVHSKNNIATSINGQIIGFENLQPQINITSESAKDNAKNHLQVTKLLTDYAAETVVVQIPNPEKPIIKLVYKIRVDSREPFQMYHVYVDTETGKVLNKINLIAHADVPATAQTLYSGSRAITVDSHNGSYRLRETGRKIQTFDATNADFDQTGFINFADFTNSNTSWNTANPSLDVHWGMEKTFDFYTSVFGRNSYDNLGSTIKNFVNGTMLIADTQNNAFAIPAPYNVMVYGLGDNQFLSPVVGLDVEGHEFTHMVVNYNGNGGLDYQAESGALNESFADIFGTCVEFFSGVNPDWNIGEDVVLIAPGYLRSMSNPNSGLNAQPDTYHGDFWADTSNLEIDNGGVHRNSGVQNFWFYLLSQGGTGTNDIGYTYNVTGIGINEARKIAYKNLTTYLGPNATYRDAFNGALQSAEDLYGNPSAAYDAVKEAWHAVGVGFEQENFCSGITELTENSGDFSDGSGTSEYTNSANCQWLIAPPGANRITLNFTNFSTESDFDFVTIYDGSSTTDTVLATYSGDSLPLSVQTSVGVGAMLVKFTSDESFTSAGWSATYTSTGITAGCNGTTMLSNPSGTFNDGSGAANYGNNLDCFWYIAPSCANSVTLNFTQFNTEAIYDKVTIYDSLDLTNQIASFSGTAIPAAVFSNTGKMVVHFETDYAGNFQGFTANYTSTGASYCSGTTALNTSDYGYLNDGSGGNNYCNNQDCRWLIQPPQATSITLDFTAFDLEDPDGNTIYDAVEIYNGTTTNAPLLGRFTGSTLPPSITATSGSMLVRFYSDVEVTKQGWSATYTSTQNSYCANTILTASNGTFSDGSGTNLYANNSNCSWLIQPPGANSISMMFTSFATEADYDKVYVYDGINNSAPLLGTFTGSPMPSEINAYSGKMFVEFVSDEAFRSGGFTAEYSAIYLGINSEIAAKFKVYPNPASNTFIVQSSSDEMANMQITDMLGKEIMKPVSISKGSHQVDISGLSSGIYLLRFSINNSYYTEKLIIR